LKEEVAVDDADDLTNPNKRTNVLFLLDSTAAMSFSAKGVIPIVATGMFDYGSTTEAADWPLTKSIYGYTFDDINKLMKESTFGMGALPTAWSGENLPKERNMYGRDLYRGNNYVKSGSSIEEDMEANKDRYYFPFADARRGSLLKEAYSAQGRGLETHFVSASEPINSYAGKNPYQADSDYFIMLSTINWTTVEGVSKYVNYGYNRLAPNSGYPYALVFKDPKYWRDGWSGARPPSQDDLVPNDSRMYQAKLALWRLFQDEKLFKGIRLGFATTFLNPVNTTPHLPQLLQVNSDASPHVNGRDKNALRTDLVSIFRVPPYGNNVRTQGMFDLDDGNAPVRAWTYHTVHWDRSDPPKLHYALKWRTRQYSGGILLPNLTGHAYNWGGMHAQFFPMWGNDYIGLNYEPVEKSRSPYYAWTPAKKGAYKQLNRASLHVPFAASDHEWKKTAGGMTSSMSHLDKIRLWIDGLGDIKSSVNVSDHVRNSQFHFYKNPEVGIAGAHVLPLAIFPDPRPGMGLSRQSFISDRCVWFSHSAGNVNYGDFPDQLLKPKAFYNAGSGEAAGAVIDFFSPPPNNPVVRLDDLDDVSFPIKCAGDDNWLVVIASGMEVKPADANAYRYDTCDAIKNLYDYTDKNNPNHLKVTTMRYKSSGSDPRQRVRVYKETALDKPIRTLVIGIAGNPDDPGIKDDPFLRSQVTEMRENLNRMARAGQGVDPNDTTSDITAFFANDVSSLIKAVNEALVVINDSVTEQPGKGSVPAAPPMDGGDGALDMYLYSYRIMRTDQWEGVLSRYETTRGADGNLTTSPKWELGKEILAARGKRDLRYWGGSAKGFVRLAEGDAVFRDLTGMTEDVIERERALPGARMRISPHDAMYKWLQGYDHAYSEDKTYPRASMLADIGQSGIVFAGDPRPTDSLPGYREWAEGLARFPRLPALYAQTNDGILHVADPSSGRELMALLPPPSLLPSRLATLKTYVFQDKLRWIDGKSEGKRGKRRSNPAYILDGPLRYRQFDMRGDGTGWGTFLLGTTGRGGSGVYMTDITNYRHPEFMWYREKTGDYLATMDARQSKPSFVRGDALPSALAPYMKLGFNSPKPAMGVTGQIEPHQRTRNFIVLPGGSMTDADTGKNGSEGAVLLVIDPGNGEVLRAFDSGSMARESAEWRRGEGIEGAAPYMGMMTSEPMLYRSEIDPHLTGRIFAADNRGNIFCVPLEEKTSDGKVAPIPVNSWRARTAATLQKDSSADTGKNSYSIPHGVAAGRVGEHIWIAGGTSDVIAKVSGSLPDGVLSNESQMIFSFRTGGAQRRTLTRDDLKALSADDTSARAADDGGDGWYIPLADGGPGRLREYVSAKPLLVGRTLFVPTFIPKTVNPDDMDVCAAVRTLYGDSNLYALDIETGAPCLWGARRGGKTEKYVSLPGVKLTGITRSSIGGKDSLILTVDSLSGELDPSRTGQEIIKNVAGSNVLLELELPSPGGSVNLDSGNNVILYWIRN
jgi:hypothetical protein